MVTHSELNSPGEKQPLGKASISPPPMLYYTHAGWSGMESPFGIATAHPSLSSIVSSRWSGMV